MMHTNICVTFDMSFSTPQSNSSALLFFEKLFFRNNSVKQNTSSFNFGLPTWRKRHRYKYYELQTSCGTVNNKSGDICGLQKIRKNFN